MAARKRAVARLTEAFDAVLLPADFQRKGSRWWRSGWFATTYVEIQKSRYGDACFVNIGRDRPSKDWRAPSYRPGSSWRLGRLTGTIADANRLDQLRYLDLADDPALPSEIVTLLSERAVPFLQRCQGPFGARVRMLDPA